MLNLCNTKRTVKKAVNANWLVVRQSHMGFVSKNYLIASPFTFSRISLTLKAQKAGETLESLRSGSHGSKWEFFDKILEPEWWEALRHFVNNETL